MNDLLSGLKGYNLNTFKKYGCYDSFKSIGTELSFFSIFKYKASFKVIKIKVRKRVDNPRLGGILKANFKILKALFILKMKTSKTWN